MVATKLDGLVSVPVVSARQVGEIHDLTERCNALEGLDLKLGIPTNPQRDGAEPRAFLWYAGGALVGYCALDHWGGPEAEICGMVHPEYRHRGIGQALLAAALGACGPRGITRLLIVCENASSSGRAFVAASGAPLASTELHMERDAGPIAAPSDPALVIRVAAPADTDAVVRVIATAFGDDETQVYRRVTGEMSDASQPFYLALQDGQPAGALKVYHMGDETGIYAFGVLPEYQGRGLGKRILAHMVDLLRGTTTRFALEVDPDNAPAIATYRACGFEITTTYGYYALEV